MVKNTRLTILTSQELKDKIKMRSVIERISITQIVEKAINEYFEKVENQGE